MYFLILIVCVTKYKCKIAASSTKVEPLPNLPLSYTILCVLNIFINKVIHFLNTKTLMNQKQCYSS